MEQKKTIKSFEDLEAKINKEWERSDFRLCHWEKIPRYLREGIKHNWIQRRLIREWDWLVKTGQVKRNYGRKSR